MSHGGCYKWLACEHSRAVCQVTSMGCLSQLLLVFIALASAGALHHRRRTSTSYWDDLAKKQGPNVCVHEMVPQRGMSYDRVWTDGAVCETKTMVEYECCQGYSMIPGELGCPMVKPTLTMLETAETVGALTFLRLQETAGLSRWISDIHKGAVTILAPTNKALKTMPQWKLNDLYHQVSRTPSYASSPSLLLHHTIQGRVVLDSLPADSLVVSMYNERPIRFNVFRNGLVTVNCVPVVKGDLHTLQGLLHTLEVPLESAPLYPLADLIMRQPELRRLASLITQAQLGPSLRIPGPFTVFAPTDKAFANLSDEHLQVLLYDEQALKAFLSHVVINGIHCSVMLNNATLRTSGGSMLRSRCTSRGTKVAAANITKADIMASNGVLHLIDRVVIPRRARSVGELMLELGLTMMLSLLPETGLKPAFHGRNTFTLFAPTNQALLALGNTTLQYLFKESEEARNLLLGHMTPGRQLTRNLLDRQVLVTKRPTHSLRMKISRGKPMVNDAVIHRADIEGSNGVIHVIDKVLIPPQYTITKYLESRGIFNRFLTALNLTSPSLLDLLESDKAPFTVFAVSDLAISHWSTDLFTYERMMSDTQVVNMIMRTHVVPDTIFTTGLVQGSYYQVGTLNTEPLLIRRWYGKNAPIYAGIALIQRPNVLCSNGVIHVVNRLIQVANPSYS